MKKELGKPHESTFGGALWTAFSTGARRLNAISLRKAVKLRKSYMSSRRFGAFVWAYQGMPQVLNKSSATVRRHAQVPSSQGLYPGMFACRQAGSHSSDSSSSDSSD